MSRAIEPICPECGSRPDDGGKLALAAATLKTVAEAEAEYRRLYERHGDHHIETGRAWDRLRRAGDEARGVYAYLTPWEQHEPAAVARAREIEAYLEGERARRRAPREPVPAAEGAAS